MLSVVTYNLRFVLKNDGINSLIHRIGAIMEVFKARKPDIVCFQEVTDENIGYLKNALPEYEIVFNQRNSDFGGEGLATAFRKDSFRLLHLSIFWLSPTPTVPGSRHKDQSGCPRICQRTVIMRLSDRKLFKFYNIHLDHIGESARVLGMQNVLDEVKNDYETLRLPFFILGDFNDIPDSQPIKLCEMFNYPQIKDLTRNVKLSYHGFGKPEQECKIDYIFADSESASQNYKAFVWDTVVNGIYLSDHYPIEVNLQL